MRRFLCTDIPALGCEVTLDVSTSHHLLRVTGIAPGEEVALFDGAGRAVMASLQGVDSGLARLCVTSEVPTPSAARPVWLLPAMLRPAAMETVIRMATELGVVRVSPLLTDRVIARGDKSDRWRRIAAAAAAQCGRADLPQVDQPVSLCDAIEVLPDGWLAQICVPGVELPPGGSSAVALFLGPEGGWSQEELEQAREAGVTAVGLGSTVLRADTASAAAVVLALR